jgi:hypothetical protein
LIIGVAVIVLGVITIVAIVAGGGSKPQDNDGIVAGSDTGSAMVAGSAEPPPVPAPTYIKVTVSSTPKGADVLIAGDKVGVTPFEGQLKRGTAVAPLIVRMVGYTDFTSKIDLAGDGYTNERITLAKVAAPPPVVKPDAATEAALVESGSGTGSNEETDPTPVKEPIVKEPVVKDPKKPVHPGTAHPGTTHPTTSHPSNTTTTTTKVPPTLTPTPTVHAAPKCQPNGQINPFDTSCDGKACPPCK